MIPPSTPSPWRCPRCDGMRAGADDFCGRCGARRPAVVPGDAATDPAALPARGGFPVVRALVLNGIILAAVVAAVLLSNRGGGPSTITFEPAAWRCDGSGRSWVAALGGGATDLRIDWMMGGPAGTVRATSTTTRIALEGFRTVDGTYRFTTRATDAAVAPECGLDPGTYTLAIRDAASGALLASGTVDLAR